MSDVPSGYTKPLPEYGDALYLTHILLPIHRHDEDIFEDMRVVPMVLSRN